MDASDLDAQVSTGQTTQTDVHQRRSGTSFRRSDKEQVKDARAQQFNHEMKEGRLLVGAEVCPERKEDLM
jgi:hypothetical protein